MSGTEPVAAIERLGVVPVVVLDRAEDAEALGEGLLAGGLPCAEITFRTPAAAGAIQRLHESFPEILIGAGTILTIDQAEAAVEAGAEFLVAPGLDATIVEWCATNLVPVLPGVMTPTDITTALRLGVTTLKFFPAAAAGGPRALAGYAATFPAARFMPTGGIGVSDLSDYLKIGSVIACGGTWLAPRQAILDRDPAVIARLAAEAVAAVAAARSAT
jgi:2-dehydro-3-deoxyphosphogluconate aldolase/(4S)-4-hydroxy-2-oxoglutarate aldolase